MKSFFNLLKLHLHHENLFCVRWVLCTSCCVGVTLTNTKANHGFVLYDQLNKTKSHSHQSQINKTQVAYNFCFHLSLQKTRHFQRTYLNPYLPKTLQSKKLTTKISSQTEFTMIRRLSAHNRHLKQDDAFNRTWWSVLSIDKLVTWQHLSIERIGGHVVLKASSCLRSLITDRRLT